MILDSLNLLLSRCISHVVRRAKNEMQFGQSAMTQRVASKADEIAHKSR